MWSLLPALPLPPGKTVQPNAPSFVPFHSFAFPVVPEVQQLDWLHHLSLLSHLIGAVNGEVTLINYLLMWALAKEFLKQRLFLKLPK